jgi:UDP-glucose 4-epimerase
MNILVTGGAGYIGSVVAEQLLGAGHHVVVFDNLSRGHRLAVPQGAELVVGELDDRACLDGLLRSRRTEAVMHFAALIEAGASMRAPSEFFRNNTANTLTLLEAVLAAGVGRFVFSSTAAVFGNPNRTPIEEDDPQAPTNPYGESKLLVERMLAWLQRVHGLRCAVLRYFNAAGASCPGRGEAHDPETHLIPKVLGVALGLAGRVDIFGTDYPTRDGTCIRDYVHVSDLASAHVLALEALAIEHPGPLTYNIGVGLGHSVREVIEMARRVTGHPIPVGEMPRRPGDPGVLVASSEKIQRDLGWKPRQSSLTTILETAWQWHRAHPRGYRG